MPAGWSGCAFWRYRLPFNKLKKLGSDFDICITDDPNKTIQLRDVHEHIEKSDIVSIQSPGYKDAVMLIKLYKSEKKKVVVDYDDFSFDLSEGNPRYAELGLEEKEIIGKDGKVAFRWRDQENGFDVKVNKEKYEAFKLAVKHADLITTTTDYLADKFRALNSNVAVCPNSIDFDLWRPIARPKSLDGQVRIGWFGGDSHFVDLRLFKGLLPRLLAKYPQVKVVIQGPQVPEWAQFFDGVPNDRIEWHDWADLRYYTIFMASRHWDIGLCPLEDNEFNRCKSNIKALEFIALGAAVVAQNMLPYSNYIKENVTGLLAGTEDEWFDRISRLVEDKDLRERLAIQAYEDAKENYDLEKNCRIWEKEYLNLCQR